MKKNLLSFFITFCLFFSKTPLAYPFAIATATPWATDAASQMLQKGGNAADATVAAALVLNVTLPNNMGLGGGGFFIIHMRGLMQDQDYFLNSRETAPQSTTPEIFLESSKKPIPYYPERVSGPLPVGVPGTLLGLYEVHKKHGKLPWKTVVEPSIAIAKNGFAVSSHFSKAIAEEWERIEKIPATKEIFTNAEGKPLLTGQILKQPDLAKTLTAIAEKGALDFYQGSLAKEWLSEAQKIGVQINETDLKNYKTEKKPALGFEVFGLRGLTSPAPSGSGYALVGVLRFLEHYYKTKKLPAFDSAERIIVTSEALRYFQNLRNLYIADPNFAKVREANTFFKTEDEKSAWVEIEKQIQSRKDRIQTMFAQNTSIPQIQNDGHAHTTHLSIVDDQGNAISYTTTIEQWFGSSLTVPKFGFLLNNELSDFDAEPGKINSPAPGKRPRSNMSPVLLFSGRDLVGVVGCAGGQRIPTALVELLENYYLFKMNARTAMAAVRFHPTSDALEIEPSAPEKTIERLKQAGYTVKVEGAQNTAQALLRRSGNSDWEAVSETRSDGLALAVKRK